MDVYAAERPVVEMTTEVSFRVFFNRSQIPENDTIKGKCPYAVRRNEQIFMTYKLKPILAGVSLILAILACNGPFEQVAPPDEIQTAAALTIQAIITPALPSATPPTLRTNTPSVLVTGTAPTAGATTTTVTATYSVPMLTVSESTNCRTGPGEEYEVVFTYINGKQLEIVGRYDPGNFWLVKSNESPSGTCWLWGQFVELTGSYWAVSSVTPPATATIAPPRAPGIEKWEFFCTGGTLTFTVNWFDNATNETGYRLFRNGEQLVELPANSITYTDLYDIPADQSVEYYLQVYSPSGSANSSVMRMRC